MNESNASSGSIKPQVDLPKCTDCTHPIAYHGPHGCRLCTCTTAGATADSDKPQTQPLIVVDVPISVEASGVHLARAMHGTTFLNGVVHKELNELPVDVDQAIQILTNDRDTWKKLAEDADERIKDLEERLELWSDDHAHRFSPTFKVNQQLEIIDKLQAEQLVATAKIAELEAKLAARPVPIQLNDGAEIAKLEARIQELEHEAMTSRRRGTP